MFPSRAILSTVVLAVFASTAPLTVQVEVVLDDVKTPDHNDMTSHCDGLTTVSFPGLGYKPTLERIEGGMNGCVYQFFPGWPYREGSTVGKTPRVRGDWPSNPGSEADTLRRIYELYAHRHDAAGRDWIVMKKQPGTWLTKTQPYEFFANDFDTCPWFFADAYRAVYDDAKNYIAEYGCIHAKGSEMNEANVLFEYDDKTRPTAHLVDWALADCSEGNKPYAVAKAHGLCQDYVYSTGGPLRDCKGEFTYEQAIDLCMTFE